MNFEITIVDGKCKYCNNKLVIKDTSVCMGCLPKHMKKGVR